MIMRKTNVLIYQTDNFQFMNQSKSNINASKYMFVKHLQYKYLKCTAMSFLSFLYT